MMDVSVTASDSNYERNFIRNDRIKSNSVESNDSVYPFKKLVYTIDNSLGSIIKKQSPYVETIIHYRNVYGSPDQFIRRKVDYSKMKVCDSELRKESKRIASFKMDQVDQRFPKHLKELIIPIARSGFYYMNDPDVADKVKCIFCQGILSGWKICDVPMKEHKKAFPTCPFLIQLNVANEPVIYNSRNDICFDVLSSPEKHYSLDVAIIIPDDSDLDVCRQFDSLNIDWREKCFEKYPSLKSLALDGFFVSVIGGIDFLTCCLCLKQIEILDGIERLPLSVLHNKHCQYLHNEIVLTDEKVREFCDIEFSITTQEIEARLDSDRVSLASRLYSAAKDDIRIRVEKKLKSTGQDYESIYELLMDMRANCQPVNKSNNSGILEIVMADHICVVCLDKVVDTIFLPCGHLRTCNSCSMALTSCPVCRQVVQRKVRNFRFFGL